MSFPVLGDDEDLVWEAWREGNARPQYIVLDEELQVVTRGEGREGHVATEAAALELLGAR